MVICTSKFEDVSSLCTARRKAPQDTSGSIRARARRTADQAQQKDYYNKRTFEGVIYKVGDVVSVKTVPIHSYGITDKNTVVIQVHYK